MYTVRDDAAKDYFGTVRKVAEMGYRGIQTHFQVCDAAELRELCAGLGIAICGVHTGLDRMQNDLDAVIAFNQALGCPDVTCPSLPEQYRSEDGFRRAGEELSAIGAALREAGIRLTYHNHAFEFEEFNGRRGYDILFEAADAENLKAEPDVYWMRYGGVDPVEYMRKLSGSIPLLHIKEMAGDAERSMAEIGEGVFDWQAIFAAARECGVEWAIVEQDVCQCPPLESTLLSIENLRRMGLASGV